VRRRKIKRTKKARATSSKVEQYSGILVTNAIVLSLAKKTRGSSAAGADRVCSDERGRKDKYRDGMPESANSVCTLEPICNRCR